MATIPRRSRPILIVLCLLVAGPLAAHTLRPAVATLSLFDSGEYELAIELNLEALLAGIGSRHTDSDDSPQAREYNRLRALPAVSLDSVYRGFAPRFVAGLAPQFDGSVGPAVAAAGLDIPGVGDLALARKSVIRLRGAIPAGARELRWAFPARYGNVALRLRYGSEPVLQSHWLTDGVLSPAIRLDARVVPRPRLAVAADYLTLGFTHILPRGLDHLLFVLGIFLLSRQLAPILWQVTAFTIAHTITLGLTLYGFVALPSAVVEPLIALSIVYVGVENALTPRLHRWRIVVVFGFGLLHGMGFAGVLTGIGLPESEFVTALVSFNVGVECAQLAVIVLALLAVGAFRRCPWYRQRIVVPASLVIAAVGLYWTVERIA